MADIHPTTIVEGDIKVAEDVVIGPHCHLVGDVSIGKGTNVIGHSWLVGPLTLGERNVIYPNASLGFAAQHTRVDPHSPGAGLVIGSDNTFRESSTVHRASGDDSPTMIGDKNYFMVNSHVGHDCVVGNHCTFVNNSALGGHVEVQDRVTIGGGTAIHQFCRIGRGAMLSGGAATSADVLPWFMLTELNYCGSINVVGMRRNGFSRDDMADVRWVYGVICREDMTLSRAVTTLRSRAERPLVDEALRFIEQSTRPICRARGRPSSPSD